VVGVNGAGVGWSGGRDGFEGGGAELAQDVVGAPREFARDRQRRPGVAAAERRRMVDETRDTGLRRRADDSQARDRLGAAGAPGTATAEAVVNGILGMVPKGMPNGSRFARLRRELEHADPGELAKPETALTYALRVVRAAEHSERPRPSFSPSEGFFDPHFGSYAVGGSGAPAPLKRRTYELQRQGRQRTDPGIVYDGIQRNLKYRITVDLVADNFNRHTHPVYRDMPLSELRKAMAREGFDLTQVAIWIPDRYGTNLTKLADEMERLRAEGRQAGPNLDDDLQAVSTVGQALDEAVFTPRTLSDLDKVIEQQGGRLRGSIVPRAVSDEIMATTKREGKVARFFERLKTIQSRTVLGTLNVNWLQADFLANGAVAAIEGVSPLTVLKGLAFYKRLQKTDPEVAAAWADELDVGPSKFQTHVPHMGATVNNKYVNTWRAFRSIPGWKSARPLRALIDHFLRAENVVANQPWRIGVAYKLLRSETMARMDRNTGLLHGTMARVHAGITLGPEPTMRWLLKNRDLLEENGRHVNEVLGDFSTLIELERRTVGRALFFYPYLRFATRLAFWTLPTKHPVKLSILALIANLTEDEQRELVGVDPADPEDASMAWGLMFGRVFKKDAGSPTGVSELNVSTINPLSSATTQLGGSEDLFQVLPPVAQWAIDQLMKTDTFRGQPWSVGGEYQRTPPKLGEGLLADLVGPKALDVRTRVLIRQLLDLSPVTRELQRNALPGEQSAAANVLTGEIPMRYKTLERQARADELRARDESRSLLRLLLEQNFRGFVPKPSDISGQLDRRRQALNLPTHRAPVTVEEAWRKREAALERRGAPAAADEIEEAWRRREQRIAAGR
jgi:hypothetical protein